MRTVLLVITFLLHSTLISQISFIEISDSIGLKNENHTSDFYGSGVSFFDVNCDGLDDVTLASAEFPGIKFYNNKGGFFEEVDLELNTFNIGDTKRPIWFDFDNDGDQDLLVTFHDTTVQLYRQDSGFMFQNITQLVGLDTTTGSKEYFNASVADIDNNGYLDIYICNYEGDGDGSNILYLNDGTSFTDWTIQSGVGDSIRYSFGAVIHDFNSDDLLDIYVLNDRYSRNMLYINNGDSTFNHVNGHSLNHDMDAMGFTLTDLNADGKQDVFITNTNLSVNSGNRFFESSGQSFVEKANDYDIDSTNVSWGCHFFDADLDRDMDLAVFSGVFDTISNPIKNLFYTNTSNTFELDTAALGSPITTSFSSAAGDLNNDGLQDLLVNNSHPFDLEVWLNETATNNNWIKLQLVANNGNINAFGASILTYVNGDVINHEIRANHSYLAQNSQTITIGLGNDCIADSIHVRWHGSGDTSLYNVACSQAIKLHENGLAMPLPTVISLNGNDLCPGQNIRLVAIGDYPGMVWSTGATSDTITVSAAGDYSISVTNQFGHSITSNSITITERPNPDFSLERKNVKCFDKKDGRLNVIPSMNQFEIAAHWNTGEHTFLIEDLDTGLYFVTVTNGYGCEVKDSMYIEQPDPLSSSDSLVNNTCFGGQNGYAKVAAIGGTQPYSYYWSHGPFTSEVSNLMAGAYTCTITDVLDCRNKRSLEITSPPEIKIDTSFNGSENSWNAQINPGGGTPPYSVTWSHNSSIIDYEVFDLDSGKYVATVIDNNDCSSSITFYLGIKNPNDTITGLSEKVEAEELWYPNPARESIFIDGLPPDIATINSIDGKVIRISKGINKIPTAAIKPGIYVIEWQIGNRIRRQRIVISH